MGQMLARHKLAYDKAVDRQQKKRHAFEQAQQEAWKALEASFRIEAWRLQHQAKKQVWAARRLPSLPLRLARVSPTPLRRPSLPPLRLMPPLRLCLHALHVPAS